MLAVVSAYAAFFLVLAYLLGPRTEGWGGYIGVVAVGFIGGALGTLIELAGYVMGRRNVSLRPGGRLYERFLTVMRRHVRTSLFALAILPGPFTFISLWAGSVRYPLGAFILCVGSGKVVKMTGFALAAYHSMPLLRQSFG